MGIKSKKNGYAMIEVIIGATIIGTVVVSIFGAIVMVSKVGVNNTKYVQASVLLEEGSEIIRVMRDFGWNSNISNLSNATNHRFIWDSGLGTWVSTTSIFLIDGVFDRTFSLSAVNRDSNHDAVSSGGTVDNGTKKVTIYVSWYGNGATTTKTMETYVFNTFGN